MSVYNRRGHPLADIGNPRELYPPNPRQLPLETVDLRNPAGGMFHVKQAEGGAGRGIGVKKPAGGGRAKVASIVMFMVPTLDAGEGRGSYEGYSDGCAESLIVWDAHHA